MPKQDNISWLQVNNTVPIIASAVMIAGSFFALKSDVALIKQDTDYIKTSVAKTEAITDGNTLKINNHETRLVLLESRKTSLLGVSLASKESPLPTPSLILPSEPKVADQSAQEVTVNNEQTNVTPSVNSEPTPQPQPQPTPLIEIPLVSPIVRAVLGGN